MDESASSHTRIWEDLDTDILVKIFQSFDVFELTSGIAHVCSGWRLACCDPLLWKTLDLSVMKSNFIKIPLEPYVYVDGRSDKLLTRLLKTSLSLSKGSITTLVFHFNLYVSDDQLTYTAERSPNLKRLVLPAWNRIKKTGICKAISCWKDLESLTMPSIANPPYFLEEISKNCKNFKELKIMGPCDIFFASTLVAYLPKLKVLSLRCSMLLREALIMILEGLPQLEVLNISHCILIEITPPPVTKKVLREIDPLVREKASRLPRFYTCMQDNCVMCQRTKADEGLLRWYKNEEGLWQEECFHQHIITTTNTSLDGVMTVEWSASSEWVLVTGGCDGAIRFWDIRRAGCFLVLDQSRTQLGRRPPIPQCSAANKGSMVKPVIGTQSSSVKARGPQKKHVNGNGVKQSSTSKGQKGSIKQRLHLGMLSIQNRATAHYGAVTGLKVTDDGMHLLSAGSDSRLRLWDVESGCNTLVNFETARLQTSKPIQLATSPNSPLAFVPCMTTVKAFNMCSGRTALTFRGHYENVNCCWFNSPDQELYTGGNDRQILVWSPSRLISDEDEEPVKDEDNWSD